MPQFTHDTPYLPMPEGRGFSAVFRMNEKEAYEVAKAERDPMIGTTTEYLELSQWGDASKAQIQAGDAYIAWLESENSRLVAVLTTIYSQARIALDYLEKLEVVDRQEPLHFMGIALAGIAMDAGSVVTGKNLWHEAFAAIAEDVSQKEEKRDGDE